MSDHQADITHVIKHGEGYTVVGKSKGKSVSFHIDSPSLERMSRSQADAFMRRSIANLAKDKGGTGSNSKE